MAAKAHPGGAHGEQLARRHLRRCGYKLLERNYRCPFGEIDLVALDGDEIVFVEVKTRGSDAFGAPDEVLGAAQRRRLSMAALDYCHRHRLSDPPCRVDVITILLPDDGAPQIEHHRDAFPLSQKPR